MSSDARRSARLIEDDVPLPSRGSSDRVRSGVHAPQSTESGSAESGSVPSVGPAVVDAPDSDPVDTGSGSPDCGSPDTDTVDTAPSAHGGAAARARARRRALGRAVLAFVAVVAVLIGAYFVPLPSIALARQWSDSLGPWFPWIFFVTYTIATFAPIPRSTFTIASGILFGPVIGFTGSMIASTITATLAFALARRLGRDRVRPLLSRPIVAAVERRLEQRGWLAVGSLRMIAAVPFSLVNYLSGLSSIRPAPYVLATVLGTVPGTAAVVFLGDALTGRTDPLMLVLTACLFGLGVLGLVVDARLPVKPTDASDEESTP